jgi:hypothetical protein
MITVNVLYRVFRIATGKSQATAFTLDYEGRQYLVTAKHAVESIADLGSLAIFADAAWRPAPMTLVGHAPANIDISVLAPNRRLTEYEFPLEPTPQGMVFGQDAYFLGFPYDLQPQYLFGPQGHPMPFVRRATVSWFDSSELLLDGHNNPGFSGGPVVCRPPGQADFRVVAVISGFKSVTERVIGAEGDIGLFYESNTGIVVAYSINAAVSLIKANPCGFPLGAER